MNFIYYIFSALFFVFFLNLERNLYAQETEKNQGDFSFFELMDDYGRITPEQINNHCESSPRALSVETRDLVHTEPHQRVWFTGRQITNVNANPGEWNGALYKPLCPGLYSFSVSYETSIDNSGTDGEVTVHLHAWSKEGQERPGALTALAIKTSGQKQGAGHASVVLEMATGDEFSLFTLAEDNALRHFKRLQLTAYRVQHLSDLARTFDMEVWDQERYEADAVPGAMP